MYSKLERKSEKTEILLVDDRIENLLSLEAVLSSPDYELVKTQSGDEALRYLLTHEPALILMDVQMPELDGFETASIIKGSERTRSIPIIFITAINLDEKYIHQGYAHGAVDYLYKPFDAHILKSKVSVFVDLAQKTRQLIQAKQNIHEQEDQARKHQLAQIELRGLKRERAEQKKYRELVDGITHGIIWAASLESQFITFVSPSAEKISGYSTQEWILEPKFFSAKIHEEDRELFFRAIAEAELLGKGSEFEHRFLTRNGKIRWFKTCVRVASVNETDEREIRGLSLDITSLIEAAETVRHHQIKSELLAEASLILSQSLDLSIILQKFRELVVPKLADWSLIQIYKSEISQEKFELGYAPDQSSEKVEIVKRALFAKTPLEDAKAEIKHELSNELRSLGLQSTITVPIFLRGKCLGMMTWLSEKPRRKFNETDLNLAEDLTRRIAIAIDNTQLYLQAQAAVRMRDEFLSIASHELKTPLTPLKLQTQSLMRSLASHSLGKIQPERLGKMLENTDRQVDRLSKLIDNLLDISKISLGKLTVSFETFDLTELMEDVIERFSEQISSAGCTLEFQKSSAILVTWDHFRIEQVIINLLTNAIKYGAGGKIIIHTSSFEEQVSISVQDHGIGIDKKDQDRIFGRFERAVSENNFGGLGLGLYIVKQILESHSGMIQVKSETGSGSTFTVILPKKPTHPLTLMQPTMSPALPSLHEINS